MSAVNFFNKLQQEAHVLEPGVRTTVTKTVAQLTELALFTIGCIGAAGILPGSTVGWLAIGLSGVSLLSQLAMGKLKERKTSLLLGASISLLFVALGVLGVTGTLSGAQVGWGVVGCNLTLIVTVGVMTCYIAAKQIRDARNHSAAAYENLPD